MSMSRILVKITEFLRSLLFGKKPPPPSGPTLLVCPNDREIRETATIGPEGGALKLGENSLVLPEGAIEEEVRFTARLLADRSLKLSLEANDQPTYKFARPATLTLSFGRCEAPSEPQRVRVYKIDEKGTIVEDLGGEVDVRARTVTTKLETLSIYTLGLP